MINKFQCEDIKIEPIRENAVPIVITPHKGFIPSMAVLFQSIIDNSCEDDFYDIIIIHSVISEDIQERYKELFAGRQNFSLRFFHILKYSIIFHIQSSKIHCPQKNKNKKQKQTNKKKPKTNKQKTMA